MMDPDHRAAAFARHEREQRAREASLTWAQKLAWLDEAQRLAWDLRGQTRRDGVTLSLDR